MDLMKDYDAAIAAGKIHNEPAQRALLPHFQRVADALAKPAKSWFSLQSVMTQGIYLYGTVGSGKTFLMDLLYYHMHSIQKARFHFHHFMQQVDGQLRHLQGQKNPLRLIAADLAKQVRLLCLDEMLVNDVAHAMILAELFQELFRQKVIMVITSNTPPDDLYKDGVQRTRFLPAILAIKTHCEVLALQSENDFRLSLQPSYEAWNCPLTQQTESNLQTQFACFGRNIQKNGEICIQARSIPYVMRSETAIWFDFDVLCNLPRSQLDYLEIAGHYSVLVLANVPHIDNPDSIKALLLMHLVDILYDNKIKLMISAAVSLEDLLPWQRAREGFQRIFSRLKEMQSVAYQQSY